MPGQSPLKPLSPSRPLDEVRSLVLHDLPPMPEMLLSGEALGDFAPLWRWLAAAQGKPKATLRRPRIAVFLGAREGSPAGGELEQLLAQFQDGSHPAAPLAREANADLQVYELGAAAGDEQQTAQALAYGMMAVQPGIDLLAVSAPHPSAPEDAAKINAALKKGAEAFDTLTRLGGPGIAAASGAIIAARLAGVPVLLDGDGALAAAAVLAAAQADAAAHARDVMQLLAQKTALPSPGRAALLIPLLKSLTLV
jgi:nicotinate-nucleotide--dimethylbenzimidazole phosphoribosyltransferase